MVQYNARMLTCSYKSHNMTTKLAYHPHPCTAEDMFVNYMSAMTQHAKGSSYKALYAAMDSNCPKTLLQSKMDRNWGWWTHCQYNCSTWFFTATASS